MASFAMASPYCWATVAAIGARMGASERTARAGLRDLEHLGLIRAVPHKSRTRCYRLENEALRDFVSWKGVHRIARTGALAEQAAASGLRGSRRALAVLVGAFCDGKWTTKAELARRLGCSSRTVSRAVADLEEGGHARVWRSKANGEGLRIKLCRTGQICRGAGDKSAGEQATELPPILEGLYTQDSYSTAAEAALGAQPSHAPGPGYAGGAEADRQAQATTEHQQGDERDDTPVVHLPNLSLGETVPELQVAIVIMFVEGIVQRNWWDRLTGDASRKLDRALVGSLASLPRERAMRWHRRAQTSSEWLGLIRASAMPLKETAS
jgi:Mn-dependent DtxR family transcriptional regulator